MNINNKQRIVLLIVIAIVVIMFLFPPFNENYGGRSFFYGYNFLFYRASHWRIDVYTLGVQLIGTLVVGGLAFLLAKDNKK